MNHNMTEHKIENFRSSTNTIQKTNIHAHEKATPTLAANAPMEEG